jgi:hypothetical protein
MGEDRSRSRKANLALIRNALLQMLSERLQERSLPEFRESLRCHPARRMALITSL